ncbi:MAG: multicopper oxidase domain-containing protein, partial [Rubrobacter sp.]|nr:multicopper oxidase domain-containing protein [Rubrobacter sp.]
MKEKLSQKFSRGDFLRAAGVTGALGVSGTLLGAHAAQGQGRDYQGQDSGMGGMDHGSPKASEAMEDMHFGFGAKGDVDLSRFDPTEFLRTFDYGEERKEGGRTVREFEVTAQDAEIEVAPGIMYPAWTYNGQVPGPTLRATEGDRIRITFKNRA